MLSCCKLGVTSLLRGWSELLSKWKARWLSLVAGPDRTFYPARRVLALGASDSPFPAVSLPGQCASCSLYSWDDWGTRSAPSQGARLFHLLHLGEDGW